MMEILIDSNLKLIPFDALFDSKSDGEQLDCLVDIIKTVNGDIADKVTLYESSIPQEADVYHQNLASYLEACWNTHAGVVIRPDMFYFTMLNEIATFIIKNADECRHLFTTQKDGKQNIVIVQDTDKCIELDRLIDALKQAIPSTISGLLPTFSTDTAMSKEARFASFAEAVSPYYRYFTSRCGISKIRLEGNLDDWRNICAALKGWSELLHFNKKMSEIYLAKCIEICQQIVADLESKEMTPKFWKEMYWQVNCGSGGPFIYGWLLDLYRVEQRADRYSLRGHVSRVKWTVLETGRKFVVHHGLFSSNMDRKDNYLVPAFSRIIFNRPDDDED